MADTNRKKVKYLSYKKFYNLPDATRQHKNSGKKRENNEQLFYREIPIPVYPVGGIK